MPTEDDQGHSYIAVLIGNVVHDIMICRDTTKELYLSNPSFVMVPEGQTVDRGYTYDGTNFAFGEITFPDPE
jgi:hypothetical protein